MSIWACGSSRSNPQAPSGSRWNRSARPSCRPTGGSTAATCGSRTSPESKPGSRFWTCCSATKPASKKPEKASTNLKSAPSPAPPSPSATSATTTPRNRSRSNVNRESNHQTPPPTTPLAGPVSDRSGGGSFVLPISRPGLRLPQAVRNASTGHSTAILLTADNCQRYKNRGLGPYLLFAEHSHTQPARRPTRRMLSPRAHGIPTTSRHDALPDGTPPRRSHPARSQFAVRSLLEKLCHGNWITYATESFSIENVPKYEQLAPKFKDLHDKGASIQTNAAAHGLCWDQGKMILRFAATGERPSWPQKKSPSRIDKNLEKFMSYSAEHVLKR